MTYRLIATQPELDELTEEISPVKELALDTEADNMYHYRNRVCLLQVRWGENTVLVDALADLDLRPFFKVVEGKFLIMHGSDFDLRLLADMCGFTASGLFDTMLAAQLLGLEKFGLSSLIEQYFGLVLPKAHQRSDWSKRPLPRKMLDYAAGDVLYLPELREKMEMRLVELGRQEWLRQRCEWQIHAGASGFAPKGEGAWRISGSRQLSKRGLCILYELWHWRETEAERSDRPPFKVINDTYLLQVAEYSERGERANFQGRMPDRLWRRYRAQVVKATQKGWEREPTSLPPPPQGNGRPEPLSSEELRRQETLKRERDKVARKLKIDPSLIMNRVQMAIVARDPAKAEDLLLPWQLDLVRAADIWEEAPQPLL